MLFLLPAIIVSLKIYFGHHRPYFRKIFSFKQNLSVAVNDFLFFKRFFVINSHLDFSNSTVRHIHLKEFLLSDSFELKCERLKLFGIV